MRIILVGNAPLTKNISHLIKEDDYIVRFNLPLESSIKFTGDRTNAIFFANTDFLAKKNIEAGLLNLPLFASYPQIILPYDKEVILKNFPIYKVKLWGFIKYKKSNYNSEWLFKQLQQTNCDITQLSHDDYKQCLNLLDIEDIPVADRTTKKAYIPSTGFIALNYYLFNSNFRNIPIIMHGFTFSGWDGHAWAKEKDYVTSLHTKSRVSFFDDTILES